MSVGGSEDIERQLLSDDEGKDEDIPPEIPPKTSEQEQDGGRSGATAMAMPDMAALTNAILELNKKLSSAEGPLVRKEDDRGKRPASQDQTSEEHIPAKTRKTDAHGNSTSNTDKEAQASNDDCEELYNSVLGGSSEIIEDDILTELVKEYESDDNVGKKLQNEQLAKLVDKMFRMKLGEKTLKERLEQQARPGNCEAVKTPRVNPGIWRKLREGTKKRDLQLYKIQQSLIKGIIPVIRLTDKFINSKSFDVDECQHMKKQGLEALSLLTNASYELNIQRHLLMKPDIGKEYASLCSSQLPFTDYLFGDDLHKHLKDIGDQNKIGAKINNSYHGKGKYPAGKANNYYKSKNYKGRPQKPWKNKDRDNKPSTNSH